jgi:AbrB family looped-hinge helix DNA binding protein
MPDQQEKVKFSRISAKGQITLTKPIREELGLKKGDFVIIEVRNNEAVIKRAEIKPVAQ